MQRNFIDAKINLIDVNLKYYLLANFLTKIWDWSTVHTYSDLSSNVHISVHAE